MDSVLPLFLGVQLVLSQRMLDCIRSWVIGRFGVGRLEEIFVIHWEWGQVGKGDHRSPALEVGMRRKGFSLRSS